MNNENRATDKIQGTADSENAPDNDAGSTTGSNFNNADFNPNDDPKVLHKDGSLADLPDEDAEGSGALDGTVGLGT